MVAWDLWRVAGFDVWVVVFAKVSCCCIRFVAGALLEMV